MSDPPPYRSQPWAATVYHSSLIPMLPRRSIHAPNPRYPDATTVWDDTYEPSSVSAVEASFMEDYA